MRSYPHARPDCARRPVVEGLETRELLNASSLTSAHISVLSTSALRGPTTISQLPTAPNVTVSTIPPNGDVNPYGVAFVPAGFARGGVLNPGDVLVSNFNASSNLQGTGTTIIRVAPSGQTSVFYQGPPGVGLSTALAVLKSGYVLVGAVPSTDGTAATVGQGSLLVINRFGHVVDDFSNPALLDGPWDMTVHDAGDKAQIFVSDVLSGTVVRFDVVLPTRGGFHIVGATQIASGYTHRGDPTAFEIGPTGLAFDPGANTLYVASTGDNAIYAIPFAASTHVDRGRGRLVYQDNVHLHGPLGLTFAPDGNLIASQGDVINPDPNQTSELVEFTRTGRFVGQFSLSDMAGGAFGVATSLDKRRFAAVNDVTNAVTIWTVKA